MDWLGLAFLLSLLLQGRAHTLSCTYESEVEVETQPRQLPSDEHLCNEVIITNMKERF